MKNAYWARFFKEADGKYSVDVPDLPGCLTRGESVEETYGLLTRQAIPLWLEDQAWPEARCADEILGLPYADMSVTPLLVRVSATDISGPAVNSWSFWQNQPKSSKKNITH